MKKTSITSQSSGRSAFFSGGWLSCFFDHAMTSGRKLLLPLAISLLALSCDKNPFASLDPGLTVPLLDSAVLSPTSENIDLLPPAPDGTYAVSISISVRAQRASSVIAHLFRPAAGTQFTEAALVDNGMASDSIANDGIYGATIPFSLIRSQAGIYRIEIVATNDQQLSSNKISLAFNATRNNSTPTLDPTSIVAPDTIDLPVGGQALVLISIAASDSDGIGDIREVAFTSLNSSTPDFKFQMRDDGGTSPIGPPFFLPSGDATAGDGIFSIVIPLVDGPTVRRTNLFSFKATDFAGAVSDSVLHYLTVR